jgi:hypothetical protein
VICRFDDGVLQSPAALADSENADTITVLAIMPQAALRSFALFIFI